MYVCDRVNVTLREKTGVYLIKQLTTETLINLLPVDPDPRRIQKNQHQCHNSRHRSSSEIQWSTVGERYRGGIQAMTNEGK